MIYQLNFGSFFLVDGSGKLFVRQPTQYSRIEGRSLTDAYKQVWQKIDIVVKFF